MVIDLTFTNMHANRAGKLFFFEFTQLLKPKFEPFDGVFSRYTPSPHRPFDDQGIKHKHEELVDVRDYQERHTKVVWHTIVRGLPIAAATRVVYKALYLVFDTLVVDTLVVLPRLRIRTHIIVVKTGEMEHACPVIRFGQD